MYCDTLAGAAPQGSRESGASWAPCAQGRSLSAAGRPAQRRDCWQLRNWPKKSRIEVDSVSSLSR